VRIRGMHLHREHFTRVEELQEQGETTDRMRQLSQQLLWKLVQQLTYGPPFERSVSDAARMVVAVAQDPSFADRAVAGQRWGEQAGQTPAAPRADTDRSVRIAGDKEGLDSWSPPLSGGARRRMLPVATGEER